MVFTYYFDKKLTKKKNARIIENGAACNLAFNLLLLDTGFRTNNANSLNFVVCSKRFNTKIIKKIKYCS